LYFSPGLVLTKIARGFAKLREEGQSELSYPSFANQSACRTFGKLRGEGLAELANRTGQIYFAGTVIIPPLHFDDEGLNSSTFGHLQVGKAGRTSERYPDEPNRCNNYI
jgi:hypothetical protein